MKAFHNWVNSQIRYPAEAFKNNLGGKVMHNSLSIKPAASAT